MGSTVAAGGRTCAKRHTLVSWVPDTLELMYINRLADELWPRAETRLARPRVPQSCLTRTAATVRPPAGIHKLMLAVATMAFTAACGSESPTPLRPPPPAPT